MRDQFEEQLRLLNEYLLEMGGLCETSIACVLAGLSAQPEKLREIHELEAEIDSKERETESLCLKLILRQQPIAADLRFISAALKMISDMERIGDQSSDIADIIKSLGTLGEISLENSVDIREMAKACMEMVRKAVHSFGERDLSEAREVMAADDTVDALFAKVKEEIIGLIAKYPEKGEACLDFLMIAKYFERIGDHATNLAEWVEFSITGTHPDEQDAQ